MPIYEYQHPETGEVFEDLRSIKDRDKPFISDDGAKCYRIYSLAFSGWSKTREVFEVDPEYCKRLNPKYVKFRDGHREKYDPSKHR